MIYKTKEHKLGQTKQEVRQDTPKGMASPTPFIISIVQAWIAKPFK